MQGQVQVIVAGVGGADGGGRRPVRGIAGVADARGKEQRLHGVGQPIHLFFLCAEAVDIVVELLGRWR